MTRSIRALSTIILLAVAAAGCGDSNGIAVTGGGNGQAGSVEVEVTTGEVVDISWTRGNARSLVVRRAADSAVFWRVDAIDAAVGFQPPVVYGQLPAGSVQEAPAAALELGVAYRVTVTTASLESGTTEFTL